MDASGLISTFLYFFMVSLDISFYISIYIHKLFKNGLCWAVGVGVGVLVGWSRVELTQKPKSETESVVLYADHTALLYNRCRAGPRFFIHNDVLQYFSSTVPVFFHSSVYQCFISLITFLPLSCDLLTVHFSTIWLSVDSFTVLVSVFHGQCYSLFILARCYSAPILLQCPSVSLSIYFILYRITLITIDIELSEPRQWTSESYLSGSCRVLKLLQTRELEARCLDLWMCIYRQYIRRLQYKAIYIWLYYITGYNNLGILLQ